MHALILPDPFFSTGDRDVSIGGFVVLSTGIKLLQFFRFQKLSQNRKVEFFPSRGFLPREGFVPREGFLPREDFVPREGFSLERIFAEKIQNLTCGFLVVNQVHYKGPSMVLDRERKLLQATGRS